MTDVEKILIEDYNHTNELLKVVDKNNDGYEDLLRDRDNLRNELLRLESIKEDSKIRKEELNTNRKQERIRNVLNVGMFGISTAIYTYFICRTFKFDENGTVTSTLGHNILNGIVPRFK